MPESPKNPDRDEQHARRLDEEESDFDGREAAMLLYGGPDHTHSKTETDSDTTDDSTDAPSE